MGWRWRGEECSTLPNVQDRLERLAGDSGCLDPHHQIRPAEKHLLEFYLLSEVQPLNDTHTHTHEHRQPRTDTHMDAHTHTHARTTTHTAHTHTHPHTHTHGHTHTWKLVPKSTVKYSFLLKLLNEMMTNNDNYLLSLFTWLCFFLI